MAYIENTAFEARLTNNALDTLANVAGKFGTMAGTDFTPDTCSAGFLCVASGRLPAEGFAGVYNENSYYMVAAPASVNANSIVYACDTHDNQLLSNGGNSWYVGTETLGLPVPADRYGNFCQIMFDNRSIYRFGEGNVSGEGGFYTIANGLLVGTASAPTTAGAVYFELVQTGYFVEGASQSFGYRDMKAHVVLAAGA